MFELPKWVPEPVIEAAPELETLLDEDETKARQILNRLVFDERMERVWKELYKKKRVHGSRTEEFWHPAYVTNAARAVRYLQEAANVRRNGGKFSEQYAAVLEREAAALTKVAAAPTLPQHPVRHGRKVMGDTYDFCQPTAPTSSSSHPKRGSIRALWLNTYHGAESHAATCR